MDENDTLAANAAGASLAVQAILGAMLSQLSPDQAASILRTAQATISAETKDKITQALANNSNTKSWYETSRTMADAVLDAVAEYAEIEL